MTVLEILIEDAERIALVLKKYLKTHPVDSLNVAYTRVKSEELVEFLKKLEEEVK